MTIHSTPPAPKSEVLTTAERQCLMETLYERWINGGTAGALKPALLAQAAVMSDAELLERMLQYESDGDDAVAQVLAGLGLSETPVDVRVAAADAGIPDAPSLVAVYVSVGLLRRLELEHFAVRDMENFGSLSIGLPESDASIGYFSEEALPHVRVLKSSAVLLNGPGQEAYIVFEVECARDGDFDVPFRTNAVRLEDLRKLVAQSVGNGELVRFGEDDAQAWIGPERSARAERHAERGG